MENHTAKQFVLQLGSLASLYLSLSFLLVLIFGVINLIFPDAVDSVWQIESASQMVRLGISMTIVFFPTYVILTRIVNTARRRDREHSYLGLTRWLIYLSLLIGGAALLIDLVTVINTFLNGEITARFIYKALAVLVVVGAAFYYYTLDAKGHWMTNEKQSITFGTIAAVAVALAVILGFINIKTPTDVREQKLDQTQITDLQNTQSRIQDHLYKTGALPETISELYSGVEAPSAPEGRPAYTYEQTDYGFTLCATFANPSERDDYYYATPYGINTAGGPVIANPDNWEHGAGEWCFERKVTGGTL
ncbi:hypothetical protein KC902_04250 [Candidatus Kaiserbacteria bacterium]|nr:hypothetical protein [Candidatus Kaiserbacteria bacterium]USN88693.1 MAG: hypothetical protein H6780_04375 [Candidatus Nomurabacteria bacterium]